jgi:hypothetical protein
MTSGREKRARKLATTLMYAACESDDGIEYGQVIAAILAFADAERREGAREALERMAEECCRAALRPEGNAGSLELVGMLEAEALRLTPNHQAPLNGSGERSEYDRGHSDAMESPFVQGMRDVLEQHGLLGAPLDRAMHERMLSNPVSQPQPLSNDGRVALGSEPSLLDATTPKHEVDAQLREMGLDPAKLRKEGAALAAKLLAKYENAPSCADESGVERTMICPYCGEAPVGAPHAKWCPKYAPPETPRPGWFGWSSDGVAFHGGYATRAIAIAAGKIAGANVVSTCGYKLRGDGSTQAIDHWSVEPACDGTETVRR